MQFNTEELLQKNFAAGLVPSCDSPCMPPLVSCAQFNGISVESKMEIISAKVQEILACEQEP